MSRLVSICFCFVDWAMGNKQLIKPQSRVSIGKYCIGPKMIPGEEMIHKLDRKRFSEGK